MAAKFGTNDPIRFFDTDNVIFDRCGADADARTSVGEINEIVSSQSNKCSSGWDKIPNKMLKKTGPVLRRACDPVEVSLLLEKLGA